MTKVEARMACAKWLSQCLEIGWPRESLDDLEAIWWRYRDEHGELKSAQAAE
ncbi:hypothetical protein [Tardiphaga sp. 839_C3_N1_4]|uniref:hypothetical protein n=1 Tax=Tardiphaga sp. 839_C3_N1_4 TaxID=3240761 RepID=UPI003F26F68B